MMKRSLTRNSITIILSICIAMASFSQAPVSNKPVTNPQIPAAITVATTPLAYPSGSKVNYVRTKEAMGRTDHLTYEQFNALTDYKEVRETTQYIDGLGRPL